MKKSRKMLSLLLALVLVVGMFSISASATVNKTGTQSTASHNNGETILRGTVSCFSNRATATTSISKSGATITAHACFTYTTPASPVFTADEKKMLTSTATSVTATAYNPDTSLYTAKYGYGGHDENKFGLNHLETRDAP